MRGDINVPRFAWSSLLLRDGERDFEGAGFVSSRVEDTGVEGELAVREVDGE